MNPLNWLSLNRYQNVSELEGEFWKVNFERWIFEGEFWPKFTFQKSPFSTLIKVESNFEQSCQRWILEGEFERFSPLKIHLHQLFPKLISTLKKVAKGEFWKVNLGLKKSTFKIYLPKFTLDFNFEKRWFSEGEKIYLPKFTFFKVEINFGQKSPSKIYLFQSWNQLWARVNFGGWILKWKIKISPGNFFKGELW